MNTTLQILTAIGGIALLASQFIPHIMMSQKLKRIPKQSTDELKAMFQNPRNRIYFGAAVKALKDRGEDVTFSFPHFLDMTLSQRMALEILGKGCLKTYFPEVVKHVNLGSFRLTRESRQQLQEMADKITELTNASRVLGFRQVKSEDFIAGQTGAVPRWRERKKRARQLLSAWEQ
jgi:hypothetical protein